MANYKAGEEALAALQEADNEGGNDKKAEFAKFSPGTTYTVKVLNTTDLITFWNYGIYNEVNSFVAENPSKKSKAGYPIDNLTPWDKAWKYHADRSKEFRDEDSQESYKYRAKQRFAFAFIDLDGEDDKGNPEPTPIIIDLTKNQAKAVHDEITNRANRLDQFAFELSKRGSGTSTVVSLSIIPILDDLTDKQKANFEAAPENFEEDLFEGLLYEMDEDEQIENLVKAGFDISLIGLEAPKKNSEESVDSGEDLNLDISDDDLPF